MHIYCSVGLANGAKPLKEKTLQYSIMNKHCVHEFHILSANDKPTHAVTFKDILRKPILICDSCVSFYDDYKFRQMEGVSRIMTIDEYLEPRIIRITKVVRE